MELNFHYVATKKDGSYLHEGDGAIAVSNRDAYEQVALNYLYQYPSMCESCVRLEKKAATIVRKMLNEQYGLWYNQITVDVELQPGESEFIHTNEFIEHFFKWYIKETLYKNNALYDEYGPLHFIEDAIQYFNKYYDGDLNTWVPALRAKGYEYYQRTYRKR